jgi:hypothetical protein
MISAPGVDCTRANSPCVHTYLPGTPVWLPPRRQVSGGMGAHVSSPRQRPPKRRITSLWMATRQCKGTSTRPKTAARKAGRTGGVFIVLVAKRLPWNHPDMRVASETPLRARYRLRQSWYREVILDSDLRPVAGGRGKPALGGLRSAKPLGQLPGPRSWASPRKRRNGCAWRAVPSTGSDSGTTCSARCLFVPWCGTNQSLHASRARSSTSRSRLWRWSSANGPRRRSSTCLTTRPRWAG